MEPPQQDQGNNGKTRFQNRPPPEEENGSGISPIRKIIIGVFIVGYWVFYYWFQEP